MFGTKPISVPKKCCRVRSNWLDLRQSKSTSLNKIYSTEILTLQSYVAWQTHTKKPFIYILRVKARTKCSQIPSNYIVKSVVESRVESRESSRVESGTESSFFHDHFRLIFNILNRKNSCYNPTWHDKLTRKKPFIYILKVKARTKRSQIPSNYIVKSVVGLSRRRVVASSRRHVVAYRVVIFLRSFCINI